MDNKQSAKLDAAWRQYNNEVDKIALEQFETKIKPFLHKSGLNFAAGNGTYAVWKVKNGRYIYLEPENLPKWAYEILETEIPGMDANSLGTIMPDYKQEDVT